MGCGKLTMGAAMAMAVLMVWSSSTITKAKAQASCATSLVPCADFLNSTAKPTSACCDPLENAIKTQKACLCSLLNDKSLTKGINITRAFELPKDCGFPASETNICASSSAPGASPPSASVTPPPGNGAAGRTTWTGFSSLLILWVMTSLMLY